MDCLLLPHQKTHAQNFTEKTFAYGHKTTKFEKVFSLARFPPCGSSMPHVAIKLNQLQDDISHKPKKINEMLTMYCVSIQRELKSMLPEYTEIRGWSDN